MYKRTVELDIYVPDGMYCNIGPRETCRFCVKHCNGHTCALSQEVLDHDGKMIVKTQECMWRSPYSNKYAEPDIKATPEDIVDATIDSTLKKYKALRSGGIPEEIALTLVKKKLKEGL